MDFTGNKSLLSADTQYLKTVAIVLIFILLYIYISNKLRRDPRLIAFGATLPGPPTVPILGNGLDFFFAGPYAMDKIMEYSKKYGSMYRLWFGKHLLVGLTDVMDLEVVFRSSTMMGKPEIFRPFQDFWGDGLFTGSMSAWKKNRKRFQPTFGNDMLPHYVPIFNQKIHATVDKMKNLINRPVFDAWHYLPYLSFDIITKAALDVELDSHDKTVLQFHNYVKMYADILKSHFTIREYYVRRAYETCFLRMFQPWLHVKLICDLFLGKKIDLIRNSLLNFSKQAVASRVDDLKRKSVSRNHDELGAHESDMSLKSFLQVVYQLQLKAYDEKWMHDELVTMITAGTDTTAVTNGFFLLAVAMHPDIQEKLYDELYDVFEDSDRPADLSDLPRLPYLDQVLKETMRRFTLVPIIFRQVEEDVKIGSHAFPAGTELMISVVGVHFNPQYYPNPWDFNPENFASDAVAKRHKLAFMPFSSGPRNCIGQNFAMVEMKLTLIALLRAFNFHTTVKLEDVKMSMGFIMTSLDGYKMSIEERDQRPSYARK